MPPLAFGLGRQEIGQPLRLAEVDPTIDERASGEFARGGRDQSRQFTEATLHRGDDGASAVKVQFRQILAGGAGRAGKPQQQRTIQQRALGIAQRKQRRLARLGQTSRQRY